jgi:N-acyl-D-aspartate/D-glutamate deacylase
MRSRLRCLLPALAACIGIGWPARAAEDDAVPLPYDVIIRHGRIVDGTGNPWFEGDVAIRGDRIVAISPAVPGEAHREIDAHGLIVAPGFIDMHSHSDFVLFEDGRAESKIRQGVTTEILGEGSSAGPYHGEFTGPGVTVAGTERRWSRLGEYFDLVDEADVSVNVASYVGIGNVWQCVMGTSFDRPTPEQLEAMCRLVDEAMRDGALGLSSQLMMPPGSLATTDDVVALCEVVRRYGGIYSTHIRNEGLGVFDSVKEAIEIGERSGVPVDIIHLKIADQQYWGRMPEIIELIQSARDRGVNVQAHVYPYTRGNNDLVSIIPPWAHEGGRAELLARLRDPEQRARIRDDIRNGVPGWYNHYTAVGGDWSRMLVSANNLYQGLTMDRVFALRAGDGPARDPIEELFDILIEQEGSVSTVFAHHTEEDMTFALLQPWCSLGSDGSALATDGVLRRGNPHPRSFGTFPRVLGPYVRDLKLLRLEDAIRKMTSLNAAKAGLHERGLLKPGMFADVTVFDPRTVGDRATYTEPFLYSTGIEYVFVNGELAVDHGERTEARPGRALRRR